MLEFLFNKFEGAFKQSKVIEKNFYYTFKSLLSFILQKLFLLVVSTQCKDSHRRCSIKRGVFKNLAKFTGKQLCQSLFFNKVADLRLATSLKKRLWHRCFPMNFEKFSRTPFLQNTSGQLPLFKRNP